MKKWMKKRMNKRNLGWILWHRFNRIAERAEQEWFKQFYTGK